MPYTITTKRIASPDPLVHPQVASRLAVATLEEAHRAVVPIATAAGWGGDVFPRVATAIETGGGTIDSLPDGTVIVVESVGVGRLVYDASAGTAGAEDWADITVEEAVAAFNAAQSKAGA